MKTYQDLLKAIQEGRTGDFLLSAVHDHQGSRAYRDAADGMAYYMRHNTTIEKYQKTLTTLTGRTVPDVFSSNYKLKKLDFRKIVVQLSSYILANGVQMDSKDRLGKDIDNKLMAAVKMALAQGVAYGYWNNDHLEIFTLADAPDCPGFVPLKDEDTSELKAGIRYWFRPVGNDTIFRATLYMEDGISEWSGKNGKDVQELESRGYKRHTLRSDAMGVIDQCDENYSRLPIATLWGSDTHESELVGMREKFDCYDLVWSGLANNIDEASEIYWILQNTGGMDDVDLAQFLQRVKTAHGAVVDGSDGVRADAHTMQVPTEARTAMLNTLREAIYEDAQLLDIKSFASGDKTTVEINAAYQAQDSRAAELEYNLIDFIQQICDIAGISEPKPTFTWNKVINRKEEIEMLMMAAQYYDDEYITKKLMTINGDIDLYEELMKRKSAEEIDRRYEEEKPEDVIGNGET